MQLNQLHSRFGRATVAAVAAAILSAVIAVAVPGTVQAGPSRAVAPCAGNGGRMFSMKRDLPAGAIGAIGMAMAERDGQFLVTDAGPVSNLPDRRFVSARQAGCTITLRYEKGGVAHTFETIRLTYAQGRWSRSPAAPR